MFKLIQAVGFDLDGTLYDEIEFISQVYYPISLMLSDAVGVPSGVLYNRLINRWKEKGSSYNRIFDEVLLDGGISEPYKSSVITECVNVFRNFQPALSLNYGVERLLDWISSQYPIFMITDGGEKLQRAKIESLGLYRWFSNDNISISGSLDSGISKPDVRMKNSISLLQVMDIKPCHVLYFGDRDVDAKFALNCGYKFSRVHVMKPVSNIVFQ